MKDFNHTSIENAVINHITEYFVYGYGDQVLTLELDFCNIVLHVTETDGLPYLKYYEIQTEDGDDTGLFLELDTINESIQMQW